MLTNNPQQELMGLLGYIGKTHFQQYRAQNYTRCAKNNITSKCLRLIYTEYARILHK